VCLIYEYLVLVHVCSCRATSVSINTPVEIVNFISAATTIKMIKLCFLMICLLLTEAAPAETAKEGDKSASQTTPSDHYTPCISNTKMKHEMQKVINHCENLIIDAVIKNVTDLTTQEMKVLERALPGIGESFNHSLQQLIIRVNALEKKVNYQICKI